MKLFLQFAFTNPPTSPCPLRNTCIPTTQGKTLEALERKMRTYETNIFFLKEFIETKGREIDFESLRGECMSMVKDLNQALKTRGETEGFGVAY